MGVAIHLKAMPISDVTRILSAIEEGDAKTFEQLLPPVYEGTRSSGDLSEPGKTSREYPPIACASPRAIRICEKLPRVLKSVDK